MQIVQATRGLWLKRALACVSIDTRLAPVAFVHGGDICNNTNVRTKCLRRPHSIGNVFRSVFTFVQISKEWEMLPSAIWGHDS